MTKKRTLSEESRKSVKPETKSDHFSATLQFASGEKALLEQLFESVLDGVFMTDTSHKILLINNEFTAIFGYTAAEAIGRKIDDLIVSPDQQGQAAGLTQAAEKGEKIIAEGLRRRKDGKLIYVALRVAPVFFNGKQAGYFGAYRDITARKKSEEILRTEKAYFQQLFEVAQEGVVMTDLDHQVIFINSAFTRIFGYAPEEAKGHSIDELVSPPYSLKAAADISRQVTEGRQISFEALRRRKDHTLIHVTCVAKPIEIDGKQVGNFAVYRDISEHKKAERDLEKEKAYLEQLFESAQEAIVLTDREGRIIRINPEFSKIFGYTSEESIGRMVYNLIASPAYRDQTKTYAQQATQGEKVAFEAVRRHKNGDLLYVSCLISPIIIDGRQVGHYGVYRDITEQRRAEEALQKEEAYLKQLFERSPVAIVMLDKDDRVHRLNEEFTRLFGYAEAEASGCLVDELILPEGEEEGLSFDRHAQAIFDRKIFECRRRRKDGTPIDVAVLLSPILINDEHVGGYALYQDITERKRAEESLRKAHDELEERVRERTAELDRINQGLEVEIAQRRRMEAEMALFRDLVNQSDDTLQIIETETGRILDCNVKAHENLGYTREEFLSMNMVDIDLSLQNANVRKEKIVDKIRKGGYLIFEGIHRRKDGTTFPVEVKVNYVKRGGKEYNIAVSRNIEERKRYEEELKLAKEAAEAANRAKSEFLANMSHEIRTPMNAVIGMTGLLLDTGLSAEQLDYIETIRVSADNLLQIINDILDFSKIEAGKLDLEIIEFDLRTAVEEVADMLASRAFQRNLEFACHVAPDIPSRMLGDPGRIRQILINLTNNGIKFTEKGEVVIRVTLERETAHHAVLHFSIADTGIGIPESRIHRLFRSFSQIDASTTRRFGGTGLGLAITKQLIEAMGGQIGVHSREGQGSTFWFTIELPKQAAVEKPMRLMPMDLKAKRILIVDDYPTNCEILSSYLKSWGCYHEAASSAQEALYLVFKALEKQQPFDLMLVDHMMPGMDGETLGRAVKGDSRLKNTILIMLTSRGMRGDGLRMKEIGFAGYLIKPVKRSLLYDCIITALAEVPLQDTEAPKRDLITRHSIEDIKKHKTRILVAEDNAINQKLVLRMLDKFGYRAEAVGNGLEVLKALELIPYDLVLMDVQMPEMDGLEATRNIRDPKSNALNHQIPIVALTAHALAGDREICLEAGMNDYLSKPIDPQKLLDTLQKYLIIHDENETEAVAPKMV